MSEIWQEYEKTSSSKAELETAKGKTSLAVQWLRLLAYTSGGAGSTPVG